MNIGMFTFFLEIKIKPPPCSSNLNEPQDHPKNAGVAKNTLSVDITVLWRRGLRDTHLGDVTTTTGPALYGPTCRQESAGIFIHFKETLLNKPLLLVMIFVDKHPNFTSILTVF